MQRTRRHPTSAKEPAGMNSRPMLAGVLLAIAIAAPASAVEVAGTRVEQSGAAETPADENKLTPSDRVRSRAWDLSETEWLRYKQLMQGIRGSISPPTISPIEVLGIHARNDEERRRYAEMWARAMREDVDRILAFQRAYDEAGKRLYPNEQLIDLDRLSGHDDKQAALLPGDRVLFFTKPDCPACDMVWRKLVEHLDKVAVVDIYVAGVKPGDDAAIRTWAAGHGIDPVWVRNRHVTLNHEEGVLQRLTQGKGEVPSLLRRRGKDLAVLRASEL